MSVSLGGSLAATAALRHEGLAIGIDSGAAGALASGPTDARGVTRLLDLDDVRVSAELTERARVLLLPQTVSAKLARLLLDWSTTPDGERSSTDRIDRLFTQEEIAQMICTTRETVTRLLAALSRREVIHINSSSILIRDRGALEAIALV